MKEKQIYMSMFCTAEEILESNPQKIRGWLARLIQLTNESDIPESKWTALLNALAERADDWHREYECDQEHIFLELSDVYWDAWDEANEAYLNIYDE